MAKGGTYLTHNKVLPGAYINFVSKARALGSVSDRGIVALPLRGNWGNFGEILSVSYEDFISSSKELFGYDYDNDLLTPLRELFKNVSQTKIFTFAKGTKASAIIGNLLITATKSGTRGNDIKIKISSSVDTGNFTVYTYLDTQLVDEQDVSNIDELTSNDFVSFSKTSAGSISYFDVSTIDDEEVGEETLPEPEPEVGVEPEANTEVSNELTATAGTNLSGATDEDNVNGDYATFLSEIQRESFDTLVCDAGDDITKALFATFTERLRDDEGVKITTVLHDYTKADFEGVISVTNDINLVYWVAGATSGCQINQSVTNKVYDGEYSFEAKFSSSELQEAIQAGEFIFYEDASEMKVVKDINTFTDFSTDKNSDFSNNQIIRILDTTANDIARIFNDYYLGKLQNDTLGRDIFRSELITYFRTLQSIRALDNFEADDVSISKGTEKGDVVVDVLIEPIASMDKLYMKCVIE